MSKLGSHGNKPRSPNEELQKHHQTKADIDRSVHWLVFGSPMVGDGMTAIK